MQYDAGILIFRMNKGGPEFLFLNRKEGWLDITKGHIEDKEDKVRAALRETKEESGLDASGSIDPYFSCTIYYKIKSAAGEFIKELTVFIAEASATASITLSNEHVGFSWLSYAEAMEKIKRGWQIDMLQCAYQYISRRARMAELNSEYATLPSSIKPWDLSARFVPGEGPVDADVMFVGQAPGAQEDATGRPFIGQSGQLLSNLIRSAGLERKDTYITSVVQFFPPANRIPSDGEIRACRDFLYKQIEIVRPKLVVLLGAVAAKEVLGIKGISTARGRVIEKGGIKYFLSLHPAAAVRVKSNMPKIEADFKVLGSLVEEMGIKAGMRAKRSNYGKLKEGKLEEFS